MGTLQLQAVYTGFRAPPPNSGALEALMTTPGLEDRKMIITSDPVVLWTQAMTACRTVATYTPGTGKRTLTHLGGGDPKDRYFETLAPLLTHDSRIIMVAGANDAVNGLEYYRETGFTVFREDFDRKLREHMKNPPPLENYEPYWSDAVENHQFVGFVFKPDGRYGILNPNGEP